MWEVLKNLINIIQALLPLFDSGVQLLPVNPKIRTDVGVISIIAALVAAFAAYYSAKYIKRIRYLPGPLGVLAFVVALGAIILFANDIGLGIPILYMPAIVRGAYVAIFFGIGLTIGGFLGLT
jgi:hypothetical protein